MRSPDASPAPAWSIVLAGGEGSRMQPVIRRWLGLERPKQYCTFVGARTMLEHTVSRALQTAPPERTLVVVGRGHRRFLEREVPGRVLEQPASRGTAAGLLLALARVMAVDPAATVAVLPSDHYVHPEERFVEHLRWAHLLARLHGERIVLMAAQPTRPEPDYGWIVPGARLDSWLTHRSIPAAKRVESFREKPTPNHAVRLYRRGALWNTLILVARAEALWELCWRLLPWMMEGFELVRDLDSWAGDEKVDPDFHAEVWWEVYRELEPADLSADVLQRATGRLIALPLADVEWSDWGRPERVVETLERIGRQPAFAADGRCWPGRSAECRRLSAEGRAQSAER